MPRCSLMLPPFIKETATRLCKGQPPPPLTKKDVKSRLSLCGDTSPEGNCSLHFLFISWAKKRLNPRENMRMVWWKTYGPPKKLACGFNTLQPEVANEKIVCTPMCVGTRQVPDSQMEKKATRTTKWFYCPLAHEDHATVGDSNASRYASSQQSWPLIHQSKQRFIKGSLLPKTFCLP